MISCQKLSIRRAIFIQLCPQPAGAKAAQQVEHMVKIRLLRAFHISSMHRGLGQGIVSESRGRLQHLGARPKTTKNSTALGTISAEALSLLCIDSTHAHTHPHPPTPTPTHTRALTAVYRQYLRPHPPTPTPTHETHEPPRSYPVPLRNFSRSPFLCSLQFLRVLLGWRASCSFVHFFPTIRTRTIRVKRCLLCPSRFNFSSGARTSSGINLKCPRPGLPLSVRLAVARLGGKYCFGVVDLELLRRLAVGCPAVPVLVSPAESLVPPPAAAPPGTRGSTPPSAPLSSHSAPIAAAPPSPGGSALP